MVRVAPDIIIDVTTGGRLVGAGQVDRPVTLEPIDAAKPWAQLRVLSGGTLSLSHARVIGAGAPLNQTLDTAAAIDVRGPDQTQPPQETFHADHVLIQDSASMGVSLREAGGVSAASTALEIHGAKHAAIRSWASAAGTIPAGSYTSNGRDEIVLEGTGLASVSRDVTLHARGVPYRVGDGLTQGRLDVATTNGVATLTIEPGVTLRFKKEGGFFVQYAQNDSPATGALVAVGTAAAPIVFTSAETTPAPGDWLGVHFNGVLNARTRLDFVRVEYAGGVTSLVGSSCRLPDNVNNAAAIRFFQEPTSASVLTNTTVVASGRHGVDRGWRGNSSLSFLSGGNDLSGARSCKETFPTPTGAACPNPPPCP